MVAWATFPAASLVVTSGQLVLIDTSPGVTRGHCGCCGASLTYRSESRPDEVDVTLASMDDPSDLQPVAHIWTTDKLPWLDISDGLPQYGTTVSAAAKPATAPDSTAGPRSTSGRPVFRALATNRRHALDGAPLASFRARTAAFVVDFAVCLALMGIVALPAALERRAADPAGALVITFEPFDSLLGLALVVAYFGIATYLGKGRTPGKRLLGIRVVSIAHDHLSLWHSIERALGYAASTLEAGFGFIQYFIHPNRQTVHDRIAETIVIVEPKDEPGAS
jgi:uncharacterized RDD family membrane protein YckC